MAILLDPMLQLVVVVGLFVALAVAIKALKRRESPPPAPTREQYERWADILGVPKDRRSFDDTPGATGDAVEYVKRPKTPPELWAYDFVCDKPMAEIRAVLNAEGPWTWIERDKEAFGDYISSVPAKGLRVRIYDLDGSDSNGPTYTADFRLDLDEWATDDTRDYVPSSPRTSIDEIFGTLLARIDARHVTIGSNS